MNQDRKEYTDIECLYFCVTVNCATFNILILSYHNILSQREKLTDESGNETA